MSQFTSSPAWPCIHYTSLSPITAIHTNAPLTSQLQILPWPLSNSTCHFPTNVGADKKPLGQSHGQHQKILQHRHFLQPHKPHHTPPDGLIQGPFQALLHGCSRWSDVMPTGGMNNKKIFSPEFHCHFCDLIEMPKTLQKVSLHKRKLPCRPLTDLLGLAIYTFLSKTPSFWQLTYQTQYVSFLLISSAKMNGWSLALSTPDPSFPTLISASNTTARVPRSPPVLQASHIEQD